MSSPRSRVAVICALILLTCASVAAAQACEDLKNLKLDHATVVSAVLAEPAPLKPTPGIPLEVPKVTVPRHCEVTGIARPTSDSEIGFLLWLPLKEVWNGKYLQTGNGGWAGSIQPVSLLGPLMRGYAASATDDGHRTTGMMPDASWAIGHPEKLIDFGYRSLHETAILSKTILEAYYSKSATRAYFQGCSDGGREALMEAERYPEDFDGIIAGAPANHWTHHLTGFVWNELALHAKPESSITVAQLPAIQKAALAVCDTLDGVKDGLIQDPRKCHFDPSVLLCHGASGADCLTQPQIDALASIYAGPKNPATGEQIYPGYEPGTEADPSAWGLWIIGPIQAAFGNTFYSQAVFEDPHWDWRAFDIDRDLRFADQKTASILNSDNPDLRTFRAHGGKLIQYHGWGDAAIAPRDSIAFYERVEAFLKRFPDPRSANPTDIQSFYRLFMVPGMQHCAGGPGPVSFGNDDASYSNGSPRDADHDVLLALDRWVNQGIPPDKLIATGKLAADQKSGSEGTRVARPLCAYPAVAQYKGQGDTNAAENFACIVEPK
jgi:feruloyl esterase